MSKSYKKLKLPKLVVILGPTASGKTNVAIKLAKKFNGEIISADSRTIYKWMNIGTAKPEKDSKKGGYYSEGIRHHLIDIIYPYENFTLADFKKRAIRAINDIKGRGKVPLLVGGTGLYIQAIVDNLKIPSVAPDFKLRKELEKESEKRLLQKLKKIDPVSAKNIGENKRKIIRALEVFIKTGEKFSEISKKEEPIFECLQLGIMHPRELLYKRIDQRSEVMIKLGLIDEVKKIVNKLKKKGLSTRKTWELPSMTGIGYKQIGMFLRKEVDLDEAIRILKRDTRHYAKRQIAWFKRDKKIKWIKTEKQAEKLSNSFLKK